MTGTKTIQEQGFTLIEIIITLLIMGVIGLGISAYFLHAVQGVLVARATTQTCQKMGLALERLALETKYMDIVYQADSTAMRYSRDGIDFGLALVGGDIRLIRSAALPTADTGAVLIDNITGFSLVFLTGTGTAWTPPGDNSLTGLARITMTLTVTVMGTPQTFSIDVNPLYNNTVNGATD